MIAVLYTTHPRQTIFHILKIRIGEHDTPDMLLIPSAFQL